MLIFVLFAFLFGACIGSFLNVVILRIPREESLWRRGSHCFSCGQPIPWYHNIPILSYLILRGRCARCQAPFSCQYFVVELLSALVFAFLAFLHFRGLPLLPYEPVDWAAISPQCGAFLQACLLYSALLSITVIDAREMIIPLEITATTLVLGLALVYWQPLLFATEDRFELTVELLFSALAGGGLLWLVRIVAGWIYKREALGLGDVHLMFMLAPFLPWSRILMTIVLASILGSLGGVAMKLLQSRREWRFEVPFGPYLAAAALVAFFFGTPIISWYARLILR